MLRDLAYGLYSRKLRRELSGAALPGHVGLIMDGNRRWARQMGLASPSLGHKYGAEHVADVLNWCERAGIRYVTVFVCSAENLQRRGDAEIAFLMQVIEDVVAVRLARPPATWQVHIAGTLDVLPGSTARALKEAVEASRECATGAHVTLAIGYGGRQEVLDAIRALLYEQADAGGTLTGLAETLTTDDIARHLYTAGQPDPDLVIRTSGEQRLSNFLLWQSVHSELYFCDAYWPAFREIDFLRALRSYAARPLLLTRPCLGMRRQVDPVRALRQIAFELERGGAPTYRVQAFRRAARVAESLPPGELERRAGDGTLQGLPGIGETTARVIAEAVRGDEPAYLSRLLAERPAAEYDGLRAALRGDCHTHSDWSDGGSPPREMAEAARDLGHEWIALTDHSPRLTVANGLSAARLREQLALVARLNDELAPFRVLTGIEVDILEDGSLDQDEGLLAELDVVVASVHSLLRMPAGPMTDRMVAAIRNPHADVLGHCTGRLLGGGRGRRPESVFDPEAVFAACREHGVAVEINCRPERADPPDRLLGLAAEAGCLFAIDSDAHAPGQLDWLGNGTVRAEKFGIEADRVINTRTAGEVARRGRGPGASRSGAR